VDFSLTLTLTALFISIALVVGSLTSEVLERTSVKRRRLRDLLRPATARRAAAADLTLGGDAPSPTMKKVATFVPKSPKEMSRLQRRLARAGCHNASTAISFALSELVGAAAGLALPLALLGASRGLLFGIGGAIVGYLLPSLWLERRIRQRQKQIQNGLPDALDLLIVSLEAGLGIDHAILKSAEELEIAYPALAAELRMVNVECRAGKRRIDAFKNFATRTQVEDVRALVAMLVQTDRFGTSVAQALRTHAQTSRTKRRQRAEERAGKIGVKLVFPLVFCLFPAFYVVTLTPAVIKFMEAFGSGGFGTGALK
jgi:tight adherence protein C